MDWFLNCYFQALTSFLAIFGAALSSLNFWHMWKRDKKELYIEAISRPSSHPNFNYVDVTVVNKSLRPIAVKEISLKYKPSFQAKLLKPAEFSGCFSRLPSKLQTSDQVRSFVNCIYYVNENEKPHNIEVSAVPYAIETEGKRYKGTPFKYEVYFITLSNTDIDKDSK